MNKYFARIADLLSLPKRMDDGLGAMRAQLDDLRSNQEQLAASHRHVTEELLRIAKSRGEIIDKVIGVAQQQSRCELHPHGNYEWQGETPTIQGSARRAVSAAFEALEWACNEDKALASSIAERLLSQEPLILNHGVNQRLTVEQILAQLRLYSTNSGYRRRLHLVDRLQERILIAQAKEGGLQLQIEAAVLESELVRGSGLSPVGETDPYEPLNSPQQIPCPLFWGEDLMVIDDDVAARQILRDGFIEAGLTQFILLNLKPDAVFFDIGAHFGYFSRLAALLLRSPSQIHSFEPTATTFQILQHNCQDRTGINLNNTAVWSESGDIGFSELGGYLAAFNTAKEARLADSTARHATPTTRNVPAVSLDAYCEQTGIVPDFIKIDAEGAEADIVGGMKRLLTDVHPIVTLEVGDFDVKDVIPSRELVEVMIDFGYDVLEFSEGRVREHVVRERYDYDNLFFVPGRE